MMRLTAVALLCLSCTLCAQEPSPAPPETKQAETTQTVDLSAPLPDIPALMHDVEKNQRASDELRKKYTYRAASVMEQTDGNGRVKKTESSVREILYTQGALVERIIEKNGKPLTDKEKEKEDERVEKEIAKEKEKRAKAASEGKATNARGDEMLSAARILELGTFSNPRRQIYRGRPTIVVDYTGDKNAKSRSSFEAVFKDLVGTVWVDEKTRNLVRAEGHFLNNFKVGGGLVANIRKDSNFNYETTFVNNEVWLPSQISGQGSVRVLLLVHYEGRGHATFYDYRKFQSSGKILPGVTEVPDPAPDAATPAPPPPQ
jgi:hypothetical protein